MTRSDSFARSALSTALVLALCSPAIAVAQTTSSATDPADQTSQADKTGDATTLGTVEVTGSRIKRATIEGPAPVTVITSEQMKKEGFATVYDALQTVTEALGTVQGDEAWGSTSVNAYPLNLRNLGPGRTLLLINGHRVADYPMPYQGKSNFANFNNIPTGIVERIEILTGAASAIYGSDAMGGVVNVILKDHIEGQTARVRWGEATRGGRRNLDLVFSGGLSGDRWNLVYNLQHFDRGVLLAKDRPFMDAEDDKAKILWSPLENHYNIGKSTPYPGLRLRQAGDVINVPGIGDVTALVNPPDGACDQYGDLFYEYSYRGFDRNTGLESPGAGSMCAQRVFSNWALRSGSKDDSGYLHGTFDFTDKLQGWANIGVWKSTGRNNTFLDGFGSPDYWDPRATDLVTGAAGGAPRNFLKYISPSEMGGEDSILTLSKELAVDISAGLRGSVGRFDWEASLGRATYRVNESFPTINQGTMADFFLGPQQGVHVVGKPDNKENGETNDLPIYTPDYDKLWNPLSPSDTSAFERRGERKAESWLNQAQFTISGDLFQGWAGPIGFAGVLEAARQGYKLTPDPKTLNPDVDGWYTPFGNIEQGGGTRNRYAAGVEFRIPLLKSLTTSVATRYDKYDAVRNGAKVTYQAGLEWRPIESLLVRGSYGTTFRAPDMNFVYAKPSTGVSDFTDYLTCANDGWGGTTGRGCPRERYVIEDAHVDRGGTPDLKYENGKAITYGIVWDAFKNFSTSLDYWSMKIENEIDDIDADQLLQTEAECAHPGWSPDGTPLANPPSAAWCGEAQNRIIRNGPPNVAGNVTININPINRAELDTSGLDYTARYSLPDTAIGNFNFALNYTYLLTYRTRNLPTETLVGSRKYQIRGKTTATVNWNWDNWDATLMMYQQGGGRDNRWGGCEPFPDGFVPNTTVDDSTCVDHEDGSITYDQTTKRHYGRRAERRYFNGSLGYTFNDSWKASLYVTNIFNKIYGDQWCGDFAYCVDDPVGRHVSAEVVYKF